MSPNVAISSLNSRSNRFRSSNLYTSCGDRRSTWKMSVIKAPNPLLFDGNIVENYIRFKREIDDFLSASELDTKSDKIKIAILETYIGDEGLKLLHSFEYEAHEEGKFAAVVGKLETHCRYHKNVVLERFKFLKTHQSDGQPFDEFFALLNLRISNCKYGDQEKSILRDQVIVGLRDASMQQRLLRKADLSLDDAVKLCKSAEESEQDHTTASVVQLKNANATKSHENTSTRRIFRNDFADNHKQFVKNVGRPNRENVDHPKRRESSEYDCRKCGYRHKPRECFAFGKFCSICYKPNHFAIGCASRDKITLKF